MSDDLVTNVDNPVIDIRAVSKRFGKRPVLHDLNQAARYATHVIAMRDGAIVSAGEPASVLTADLVEDVFGLPCVVVPDPETGTPLVVPRRRAA